MGLILGSSTGIAGTLVRDGSATPHQLSLVVTGLSGLSQSATADVRIRTNSPQGSWSGWRPLFRVQPSAIEQAPPWGSVEDVFAWTLFGLSPGTTYDVELRKTLGATVDDGNISQFTTKSLPGAAGTVTTTITNGSSIATIQAALNGASAAAGANPIVVQFEDGSYDLDTITWPSSLSGASEASPTYIRGESRTGVTFTNDEQEGIIRLTNNLDNVVFEDFSATGSGTDEIPGFETSTLLYAADTSSTTNITVRRVTCTGVNRGLYARTVTTGASGQHVGWLAYNNSITGNNLWSDGVPDFFNTNRAWDDYGILVSGDSHAFFHNDITAFGDVFSCTSGSTGDRSEQDRNQHFYWNDVNIGLDDFIENDDGYRNITCYQNRARNVVNCGSCDVTYGGPFINWGNLFINVLEPRMYKHNSANSGWFYYNNTYAMAPKDYRSNATQDDIAIWYQPNNGNQTYCAFQNNVLVMITGSPDDTLRLENFGYAPADFSHNAWYADTGWQFAASSSTVATLALLQADQPAANGVFNSVQRFANDVILSSAQEWVTTITLGVDAGVEVTADYTFSDFELSASSAENAGIAIPNITDNLTESFTGAAPDMGCNIPGLSLPNVGDQSALPSWVTSASVGEVVIVPDNATTCGSACRAMGANSSSGTDPDDICTPWSGAGIVTISNQLYLVCYGGGHGDSAFNGMPMFGPLTGAGSDSPQWGTFLTGSDPSAERAQPTYTDGRQTSHHSYSNMQGVNDRLYVMSTSEYWPSAASSSDAYYFTQSGQTSITNGPFGTGGSTRLTTALNNAKDRIYVIPAASASSQLRYYRITEDDWTTVGSAVTLSLFTTMALDTNRNNVLILEGNGADEGHFFDLDGSTQQSGKNFPAAYFENCIYDHHRDVFASIRNNSLVVDEVDASALTTSGGNPTWTTRTFTGSTPPSGNTGSSGAGHYSRGIYVRELGGYLLVPNAESDVYFFRSTTTVG